MKAIYNNEYLINYLFDDKRQLTQLFFKRIISRGYLRILSNLFPYLPQDEKIYYSMGKSSNLKLIKYLISEMCHHSNHSTIRDFMFNIPRNKSICLRLSENAAKYGHKNILLYLIKHKYPISDECFVKAVHYGKIKFLEWIKNNIKCILHEKAYGYIQDHHNIEKIYLYG